uniref:Putative secreted peptide n=1 Tax=Anopheles braziliensis TaxID=58242 RepID=A0A2M3ZTM3_9DIPT
MSSSFSTLSAIFAWPLCCHFLTAAGVFLSAVSNAPTAAWPHCAPILPLPIFRSFRTTSTILYSPPKSANTFSADSFSPFVWPEEGSACFLACLANV